MFSEALRILDRNTAELMVDRMKDEMETLKAQNEELKSSSEEKDAEIARLKKNRISSKKQQLPQP